MCTDMCTHTYVHPCTCTYILSGTIPKGGPVTLRVLGKRKSGGYVLQKLCREKAQRLLGRHSQASLLSKLESPMAKAWSAHSG